MPGKNESERINKGSTQPMCSWVPRAMKLASYLVIIVNILELISREVFGESATARKFS